MVWVVLRIGWWETVYVVGRGERFRFVCEEEQVEVMDEVRERGQQVD